MLGCQDFCGYYDWTFHHVRRRFGQEAVHALWREAIGGESQQHYLDAARADGLQGLLNVWTRTGEDEQCDWTFTLDESRNTLRWDMRACPSKGYLLERGMQFDEDYCDHCMGWIAPMLARAGVRIEAHEHNHAGQCWAEMCVDDGRPSASLDDLPIDIRRDPRWERGYVDRFERGVKLPVLPSHPADPAAVLAGIFAPYSRLVIVGRGPSAADAAALARPGDAVLITDPTYASRDVYAGTPTAVMFGDGPTSLTLSASRYNDAARAERPVLLHAFLPSMPFVDFASAGLPRPLPLLPLLIRSGLYEHVPGRPHPTSGTFLVLLAAALRKRVVIRGIDLYGHASGKVYAADAAPASFAWPARHSMDCEVTHLRRAREQLGDVHFDALPEVLRAIATS